MKLTVVSIACSICSLALFPLLAIGGVVTLFIIAAGVESLHSITGASGKRVAHGDARSMAMRV